MSALKATLKQKLANSRPPQGNAVELFSCVSITVRCDEAVKVFAHPALATRTTFKPVTNDDSTTNKYSATIFGIDDQDSLVPIFAQLVL
jgi:hypothetical protein